MHYVIVGGGSAGWMTAAALSRAVKNTAQITLTESQEIGTVGVGEATIPPLQFFNKLLGVNEREFIQATQASFKLGIEFCDWTAAGHRYFHQFGEIGPNIDGVSFHQLWLRLSAQDRAYSISDYAPVAASQMRFLPPLPNLPADMPQLAYAYHFDAGLYARFLRKYAEARGVVFRVRGAVARHDGALFLEPSWIAVMLGQRVTPQRWDPLAHTLPMADLQKLASEVRERLHRAVARMPTHTQFIEHNCKAP